MRENEKRKRREKYIRMIEKGWETRRGKGEKKGEKKERKQGRERR